MDYKEQQTQEIEALQAIYQEDELQVTCDQYPNISLRVNLKSNQENECAYDFDLALVLQLPETYPDVIPQISLEGLEDIFSEDRVQQAVQVSNNCFFASVADTFIDQLKITMLFPLL
ncbi:RWD domain protein [Cooperia oncophora]